MNSSSTKLIVQSVIFLILQVVIFRNIALLDVTFCFIYVAIILLLPLEMDRILILVIAFIIGLIIDMFYNSFGVHTSASVLLAFLRFYWGNIITPQGGYEINISPNLKTMGFQWFSTYFLPMLFVHHFTLFFTEAGGFFLFWFTLLKVIMSTFFTFLVILLIQILFFSRKRGI